MTLRAMASSLAMSSPSPVTTSSATGPVSLVGIMLHTAATQPAVSSSSVARVAHAAPSIDHEGISRALMAEVDGQRERADRRVRPLAVPADQLVRQREVQRHQRKREQQDAERRHGAGVRAPRRRAAPARPRLPTARAPAATAAPVIGAATRARRPQSPARHKVGSVTAITAAGNSRNASTSLKTAL